MKKVESLAKGDMVTIGVENFTVDSNFGDRLILLDRDQDPHVMTHGEVRRIGMKFHERSVGHTYTTTIVA